MNSMLTISRLSRRYPQFQLHRLNLNLHQGEVMGFIGENGAGKTTTIKAILHLIRSEGEILIFGKPWEQLSREERGQIGVVLDGSHFHGSLRIPQIERMLAKIYPQWQRERFLELCGRFALPEHKKIGTFSTGMKTKLSIAAALSHNARLLILDEPTSGLDPIVRDEILDLFYEFIQEETHSILFSSHITADIEKIADSVAFIHQGQLQFVCQKDVLHDEYGIVRASRRQIEKIAPEHRVALLAQNLTCQALVRHRAQVRRDNPDLLVESASLEEIMLCMIRGER